MTAIETSAPRTFARATQFCRPLGDAECRGARRRKGARARPDAARRHVGARRLRASSPTRSRRTSRRTASASESRRCARKLDVNDAAALARTSQRDSVARARTRASRRRSRRRARGRALAARARAGRRAQLGDRRGRRRANRSPGSSIRFCTSDSESGARTGGASRAGRRSGPSARCSIEARGRCRRAGWASSIQQQVDAVAAGVLFTATTDGAMLVEFAPGLGDALVSRRDRSRAVGDRSRRRARWSASQRRRAAPFELDAQAIARAARRRARARARVRRTAGRRVGAGGGRHAVHRAVATDHGAGHDRVGDASATAKPGAASIAWSNANVNENFPGADLAAALLDRVAGIHALLPQPRQRVRHLRRGACARWSRRSSRSSACTARGCTTTSRRSTRCSGSRRSAARSPASFDTLRRRGRRATSRRAPRASPGGWRQIAEVAVIAAKTATAVSVDRSRHSALRAAPSTSSPRGRIPIASQTMSLAELRAALGGVHGDSLPPMARRVARRRGVDALLRRARATARARVSRRRARSGAHVAAQGDSRRRERRAGAAAVGALAARARRRRRCSAASRASRRPMCVDAIEGDAALRAIPRRIPAISRRVGLPLLGGADAHEPELPGESRAARRHDSRLCARRRRFADRRAARAGGRA